MADPKYADLPGIAHGEPDVYETNDLPESDQTADFYEEENESIERLNISAHDAFNKFKGKSLSASKVDFSERIGKHIRTGYDWELVEQGTHETPLQKYQRLQCEMKELLEEVEKIKDEKNESRANILVSGEQVQQALDKLLDLRLEESLGPDVVSSITNPQGSQLKQLFVQLEQFKSNVNEMVESQAEADSSGIVYQLNYRPEQAKFVQTHRLAELENRLHRLETVVGTSQNKLSRLATLTSKGSLMETAEHLSATASMLDSSKLDHVEGRLTALTQKLDTITEKRAKISENPEKDNMIIELYNVVKNTESISSLLPQAVERLKALEALHNKATEFAKTLVQVESLQEKIAANIDNNKTLLQGVQESFAINLDGIKKNLTNLDARVNALTEK